MSDNVFEFAFVCQLLADVGAAVIKLAALPEEKDLEVVIKSAASTASPTGL